MIVKIDQGSGCWLIYDEVSGIDYTNIPRTATSMDELFEGFNGVNREDIKLCLTRSKNVELDTPCVYNTIAFRSRGEAKTIVFDNIAYICNDRGDTIERLNCTVRHER